MRRAGDRGQKRYKRGEEEQGIKRRRWEKEQWGGVEERGFIEAAGKSSMRSFLID